MHDQPKGAERYVADKTIEGIEGPGLYVFDSFFQMPIGPRFVTRDAARVSAATYNALETRRQQSLIDAAHAAGIQEGRKQREDEITQAMRQRASEIEASAENDPDTTGDRILEANRVADEIEYLVEITTTPQEAQDA